MKVVALNYKIDKSNIPHTLKIEERDTLYVGAYQDVVDTFNTYDIIIVPNGKVETSKCFAMGFVDNAEKYLNKIHTMSGVYVVHKIPVEMFTYIMGAELTKED